MDEIDHYDMINAPQFLDFAALVENGGGYDDPETDKYFETHREEDDFFIPVDNLQPTIQLLNEQNSNAQTVLVEKLDTESLDDISVEYYNTPNGKQSSKVSGNFILRSSSKATDKSRARSSTPVGKKTSTSSLTPSFHTPAGEEDKENSNYTPQQTSVCSDTFLQIFVTADKTIVASPSSRRTTGSTVDGNGSQYFLRESLLAQLEKLNVVDNEDGQDEKRSSCKINVPENNATFNAQKNNYWNLHDHTQTPTPTGINATVVVDTPPESPQEVQIYPLHDPKLSNSPNIKLNDGNINNQTETRPYSIYIAPSVGCEVVWDHDDDAKSESEFDYEQKNNEEDVEEADEVNELHRSENCLASLVSLTSNDGPGLFEVSPVKNLRRVSSCSDLAKFLVPKNRKTTTVYGFNPRAGITIPKTPDTAKRRAASRVKTSSNCSSQSSIASSIVSSISSVSKIPTTKPLTAKRNVPVLSGFTKDRTGVTNFTTSSVVERLGREKKRELPVNTYVSFAQAVASFQKNTPTRYRTAPRGGYVPPKRSISVDTTKRRPSPVSPHSPNLMTKQRARQTMSNVENTAKKLEVRPAKTPLPANPKLRGPMFTLPKKIELKTTKPQPFNLTEHTRPKVVKEEPIEWKFKARPAPVKVLHGPTGVKERAHFKPTAPVEMHFASEDRIRERHMRNAQSKDVSPVRQIPPKTSRLPTRRAPSPMRPVESKTATVVQPFSFEQRDRKMKQKKADKLKQEEHEVKNLREFHANPLPSFNNKLPKRKAVEPTHVEPFRFKSDERGAAHQAALRQKLEEEERNLREQQKFHANPAIVVKKKPFEPARSVRPLVEPLDIQLNSDLRAQEREKFDEIVKQRDQEFEERRLQEETEREERERDLELQMRQQLVHKAKPFKNARVFEVKASDKRLVEPKSPDFTLLPSQRRPKVNSP